MSTKIAVVAGAEGETGQSSVAWRRYSRGPGTGRYVSQFNPKPPVLQGLTEGALIAEVTDLDLQDLAARGETIYVEGVFDV